MASEVRMASLYGSHDMRVEPASDRSCVRAAIISWRTRKRTWTSGSRRSARSNCSTLTSPN
jgi:hypothetical protein